jgi:hypothetical protein
MKKSRKWEQNSRRTRFFLAARQTGSTREVQTAMKWRHGKSREPVLNSRTKKS